MFLRNFFLNWVQEAPGLLSWKIVAGRVWTEVLVNSEKYVERIIRIPCKVGEEGNVSWDEESTGTAQMGREIQTDVCYHVQCNEAKYQVEDEPGWGEGFSLFCWRAGSRKRCVISRIPPVWSEMKLSPYCAACFQGWSGTAELQLPSQPLGSDGGGAGDHRQDGSGGATRSGMVCPPWTLFPTLEGGKPGNHHGPQLSNTVPRGCGSAARSSRQECFSNLLPLQ